MNLQDDKSLASIAAALAHAPGATYQEIAKAIGVSRATLYRFCSSKDELIHLLHRHCIARLTASLHEARLDEGSPVDALTRLVEGQVVHKELHAFLMEFWSRDIETDPELGPACLAYEATLDQFFLRGQREGVFRVDIPAAALNESLGGMLIGLMEGERRGRIARASVLPIACALILEGAMRR
ncbi:TetR/AcrR family transcriptional regulator [Comamonas sp. JUb58]|uniref:TetR/AcrR family transcriptional regulator n=1 Tax=Comamonas sp. JUb58 TaxID=2485114 RepID=UPI0014151CA4|nr:TetR/AcrR family transcriptional regulator [Comamonas sp. JUb58]